jgi:tetratricopeptide (TPR) repeat protein
MGPTRLTRKVCVNSNEIAPDRPRQHAQWGDAKEGPQHAPESGVSLTGAPSGANSSRRQFGTNRDMGSTDSSPRANRRLDTWKEIGAFFGRDERTVKRWETTRGLPVHRVPGAGRANVYAYTDELAEWLSGAKISAENDAEANSDAMNRVAADLEGETSAETSVQTRVDANESAGFVDRRLGERRSADRTLAGRRNWTAGRYVAFVAAVLVAALVTVTVVRRVRSDRAVRPNAMSATSATGSTGGTGAAVVRDHTPDPEAEQLYLKGIYYWQKRTPESLNQAVDYFTQAVVRDPQYAEAYVGLADCYNLLREYSRMPPNEAYPRAEAAAKRAIALDDSLSGAHSALGFVDFYWLWDVAGAQREFVRALTLDPNSVNAHHWYSTYLLHLGRYVESLEEIERAQKLDPNSTSILADKGLVLFHSGQTQQAAVLLKQLVAAEPDFLSPHNYLATVHLGQGEYPQYLAERRKAAALLHDQARLDIVTAGEKGLARGGAQGMWRAMLKEQQRLRADGKESAYNLARTCALLGRKQAALDYLRTAYQQHETELVSMRVDEALLSLHDEPRFREILTQVGLPPLR